MTARSRRQDGRAPAIADGFNGDGRDITEVLGPPAAWEGASDIGLPGGGVFPAAVDPAQDYRQAIARANAEAGTAPRYMPRPDPTPLPMRTRPPGPDMFPALPEPPPPAAPVGYEVTGRETGQGWPHLFELRCAYPAALAATPIPCDSVHRDAAATSFRALRRSAQAAGWHMDGLEQWACPRCCQVNPEYRTLYPVTVYDIQAAEAYLARDPRGVTADWMEADGSAPDSGYGRWVAVAGVEVAARAAAELGLLDRTLLHHRNSHKRGRHADELEVTR